jgi:hypothetical protein
MELTAALSQFFTALSTATAEACIQSISDPFDILTDYRSTWPNNELAGVYLFFSESHELLYVGKSSFLGRRFMEHFRYSPDRLHGVPVSLEAVGTRYIISIGLREGYEWLAPSLEEYLIQTLRPPRNKEGNF